LRLKVFWIVKISIFRAVSFIGLFLIAVGTGGIKPCVAPFGAEQFQLPEQEAKMKQYFSWFYASINLGATASTLLTPNLRNQECLDASSCFPLAFGVPAALMVVALSKYRNKKLVVLLPTDLG
jgi:solute carrier family 15 oligopeptide transporter 1